MLQHNWGARGERGVLDESEARKRGLDLQVSLEEGTWGPRFSAAVHICAAPRQGSCVCAGC